HVAALAGGPQDRLDVGVKRGRGRRATAATAGRQERKQREPRSRAMQSLHKQGAKLSAPAARNKRVRYSSARRCPGPRAAAGEEPSARSARHTAGSLHGPTRPPWVAQATSRDFLPSRTSGPRHASSARLSSASRSAAAESESRTFGKIPVFCTGD